MTNEYELLTALHEAQERERIAYEELQKMRKRAEKAERELKELREEYGLRI